MRPRPGSTSGRWRRLAPLAVCLAALLLPVSAALGLEIGERDPSLRPLALETALAWTLENNAALRLADARREQAASLLREARGSFDARLDFDLSYQRAQGELLPAQIEAERNKRLLQQTIIDDFTRISNNLEIQLDEADRRPIPDCGTSIVVVNGVDVCLTDYEESRARTFDEFLRTLIRQEDDPAQRQLYEVILQQQLDLLRQTLFNIIQDLRTQVRTSEQALERLGVIPEIQERFTLQLDLRWRDRWRNGVEPSFGLILEGVEDNFDGKELRSSLGGKGLPNTFTSFFGFEFQVPLARGGGRPVVTAPERAAELERQAAALDQADAAARAALATALVYIDLAAAQERQILLEQAVAIEEELTALAEGLVDGDALPSADLAQVQARLAGARQALSAARLQTWMRRIDLADAIGLEAAEEGMELAAGEGLPEVDLPPAAELAAVARREGMLAGRHDLRALGKRREAATLLQEAAEKELRGRADLSFAFGYNGLHESFDIDFYDPEGFREAMGGRQTGPTGFLRLAFEVPRGNRSARGRLEQSRVLLRQVEIQEADLDRASELEMVRLLNSIERAAGEVAELERSTELYREAFEAAVGRLREGEVSLVDTIFTEEQLTQAQLAALAARRVHARLVARLEYERGALVTAREEPDGMSLSLGGVLLRGAASGAPRSVPPQSEP